MQKLAENFGDTSENAQTRSHGNSFESDDEILADMFEKSSPSPVDEDSRRAPEDEARESGEARQPDDDPDSAEIKPEPKAPSKPEAEKKPEEEKKDFNVEAARLRVMRERSEARIAKAEADATAKLQAYFDAKTAELAKREELLTRPAIKALSRYHETGDTAFLVELLEQETGESYDELQKAILERRRRSPAEARAMKEAAELRERLERLEREREEKTSAQTAEQVVARDKATIATRLQGTEVANVPRFVERIYARLDASRSGGPGSATPATITLEDAAGALLKSYNSWLQRQNLRPVETASPQKAKVSKPEATKTQVHNQTRGRQPVDTAPGNGDEDDIDLILSQTGFTVGKRHR